MTNSFSVEGIVIEEAFTAPTKWFLSSENDVTNAMNVTHASRVEHSIDHQSASRLIWVVAEWLIRRDQPLSSKLKTCQICVPQIPGYRCDLASIHHPFS